MSNWFLLINTEFDLKIFFKKFYPKWVVLIGIFHSLLGCFNLSAWSLTAAIDI